MVGARLSWHGPGGHSPAGAVSCASGDGGSADQGSRRGRRSRQSTGTQRGQHLAGAQGGPLPGIVPQVARRRRGATAPPRAGDSRGPPAPARGAARRRRHQPMGRPPRTAPLPTLAACGMSPSDEVECRIPFPPFRLWTPRSRGADGGDLGRVLTGVIVRFIRARSARRLLTVWPPRSLPLAVGTGRRGATGRRAAIRSRRGRRRRDRGAS
jgi:hypothetical protein